MPAIVHPRRRSLVGVTSFLIVALLAASVGAALVSSATSTTTTAILANRISVPNGTVRKFLLRLPSLGYLYVDCIDGGNDPVVAYWKNSETYAVDVAGFLSEGPGQSFPPGTVLRATHVGAAGSSPVQGALDLGRGVSPNGRRALHVEISIWRSALNAPCVAQAVATSWATS
jgi:hypothetical protein